MENESDEINITEALQDQIYSLNSKINDLENEKQNLEEKFEDIRDNIKLLNLKPNNEQEKEAIDDIFKILNREY